MRNSKRRFHYKDYILEIVLICLAVIIAFLTPGFFTSKNILNVLRNASLQGVIAFGLTMTIIGGQIDLSVGSAVALYGVVVAKVTGLLWDAGIMPMEYGVVVGMLAAVVLSLLMGMLIGWIHIQFKMPTFIITLAFMNISYGLAAIISGGFPLTSLPSWYSVLGAGQIAGIPVAAIILFVVFLVVFFIMKYCEIGREIYAVGGNEESARLCGINVAKVKMVCMIAPQLLSALSGIIVSAQVMAASSQFGKGYEMTAIPSVIIGGASLTGGIGKVWGTFIGIIFLGIIANGMTILNINEFVQYVVRGVLILVAVAVNTIVINQKQGA